MGVLICAATSTEAAACRAGVLSKTGFEVLCTGVGLDRAYSTLKARLDKGSRPDLVVSSGFAGALSPGIALHSWVTAGRIVVSDSNSNGELFRPVSVSKLLDQGQGATRCNWISAAELTSQAGGRAERLKEQLGAPLAVDMESAALAQLAEAKKIPFMVLRLVTDTPEQPLPSFLLPLASAMSTKELGLRLRLGLKGLKIAIRDPKGIIQIVRKGREWSRLLQEGWQKYADELLSKY